MAVATHLAVMNRGRLEQFGAPEDLYARPATEMVARFIGRGRTLPVEIFGFESRQDDGAAREAVLDVPGDAPAGAGWLCFHASDLAAVQQGGHLKAELAGQIFQNGAWLSHFTPLGLDADLVSLPLKERLSPGARISLAFSGGWVIPRAAANVASALQRRAEHA